MSRPARAISAKKHLPSMLPGMERIGDFCQDTDGIGPRSEKSCGIDLSEGFFDGTFAPAKKGRLGYF